MTPRRHYRRILLVALATHLPVLFNDGIYWDSWLPEYAAARGDLYLTAQPFHDTGVPLVGYLYYAIGQLPYSVFVYKLLAFGSTCAIGLLAYAIAARSRFLSETESALVGISGIVWAAFRVHAVDVIAPYLLATALLFFAFWYGMARPLAWWRRAIAAAIVTTAILLYSPLYVFHYGLLATWLAIDRRDHPSAWRWLLARADFVLLPVVLFVAAHLLFPPSAAMTNNYSVKLDTALFAKHAHNFWTYGVWLPIREGLNRVSFAVYVVLAAGAVVLAGRRRIAGWRAAIAEAARRPWRDIAILAGAAGSLFVFGALAFVLVGKSPDRTFWWSRNALLVPWGIGLGFLAVTWALHRAAPRRAVLWCWLALVGWIAVGNWVQHQQTYVMLQARWISYRSVVHNLEASRAFDDLTFLHVDESELLAGAGYQDHTAYTWSVMFSHLGWAAEDKAVVGRLPFQFYCDEVEHEPLEWRRFALSNVDLAGPHGRLIIHNGPEAPYGRQDRNLVQLRLVAGYYLRRFFMPSELPAFLARVTELERRPLDEPAPRCSGPPRR